MGSKKIAGQKSTQKSSDVASGSNHPGWPKLTGGATKLGGTGGEKKHSSHDKKMTY